jgi:hypothetical protein
MLPPHPLVGDQLVEARREIIGEPGFARLRGEPRRAGRFLRERRAGRQRKAAGKDLAAIEVDSHAQPSAPPAGGRSAPPPPSGDPQNDLTISSVIFFASPKSIIVLSRKNSSFSTPA